MSKLLTRLPKAPPRRYVPHNLDCADLKQLSKLFEELLARPLPTIDAVKKWVADVQELLEACGEHSSLTYIRKSVDTRDKKARAAYLHLIQTVEPGLASYRDKLNRRLLEHPLRAKYPKRWALMLKEKQNAVDLFREKNIPVERQIEETAQKYAELMGGLMVMFDGKKQTLPQMGRYFELTDRDLRRQAWETVAACRFKVKNDVEDNYDQLVKLRQTVARNTGYPNFRDFCHRRYNRFDYSPQDCFTFHQGVEEVVVPAVNKIMERRRKEMGLDDLRPWDLAVDPLGREPLKPFRNGADLAKLSERVFRHVDPELGRQFATMMKWGLLDLDNRPGKEPGGYQTTLSERRLPFIFMNAVGRDGDVRTLLHEGGHAFHTMATREEPVLDYRHAPMEFCEVASMSMELLANPHTGVFYPDRDDHERSTRYLLEGIVTILPWIATIDAFQQWIYTHLDHSRSDRRAAWIRLRRRFSDGADWTGLGKHEEILWHRQLHLFHYPFYYIEYGVAQLGALMVWRRALQNPKSALASYKRALALGGSVGLKDLFRAAGGQLDFSARTIRPLVEAVMERLGY